MRLCFIGKYPPIEGGVSSSTYWLARGLAERGHVVHLVTNADEVEDKYRIHFEDDDWEWYQPEFESSGGKVHVYNAAGFSRDSMAHIPRSNPFVTKLASVATEIVRKHNCEAILAYYYEPYGVAGWMASQWTGVPFLLTHSGSDLDRLFRVPDLATTYREINRSAASVITRSSLVARFLAMGVSSDRVDFDVPFYVPRQVFHPAVGGLDVARVLACAPRNGHPSQPIDKIPFDSEIPAVGIYGKIGPSKGTYDLIKALGKLADEKHKFCLLAMVGASQGEMLVPALRQSGLVERTHILPFLPHWKVPRFIRTCTTVCFLERAFPVAIHGPIVPREVLACGTCLVLSEEIAAKQRYRHDLMPGENVVVVKDPRDFASLADSLRSLLANPERARAIGERGYQIARRFENFDAYISGWEDIFSRRAGNSSSTSRLRNSNVATITKIPVGLDLIAPKLLRLLETQFSSIIERFRMIPSEPDPFAAGVQFCDYVTENLFNSDHIGRTKILDALRYQRVRLASVWDYNRDPEPLFPIVDQLQGCTEFGDTIWNLRPVKSNALHIEEFNFDVSALFSQPLGSEPDASENGYDLIAEHRSFIVFQRSANYLLYELRIDDASRELISLCDGTRTTRELLNHIYPDHPLKPIEGDEGPRELLKALQRLHRASVIAFGDYKPNSGWKGGLRSPISSNWTIEKVWTGKTQGHHSVENEFR